MAPCSATTSVMLVAIAAVAFLARSADCQAEKRLTSVQHQQQQQQQFYDSSEEVGEVIKSKIRPDTYSQDPSHQPQYEKHGKQHQQDAVGSASTVYGEQYGGVLQVQQDQPVADEEAQESINSGSINNHRIPQYTRGAGGSDVVEGKNVGNRAIGNNYHPGGPGAVIAPSATGAGYAVDSAFGNLHYSSQDLVQDQNYQLEFKYHDYDKMTKYLRTTSSRFPNLTALYSIGKSVQGKCNVMRNTSTKLCTCCKGGRPLMTLVLRSSSSVRLVPYKHCCIYRLWQKSVSRFEINFAHFRFFVRTKNCLYLCDVFVRVYVFVYCYCSLVNYSIIYYSYYSIIA